MSDFWKGYNIDNQGEDWLRESLREIVRKYGKEVGYSALHLAYNINIAVIDLPENRHSFRAADNNPIDMDLHDFRFLDKPGHIGYLSFKK